MATVEELKADLAALKEARLALLTNGKIKEYWRDGRRVVYQGVTVADLNAAISQYETDIAAAEAEADGSGRKRFRALGVRFC